MFIRLLHRSAVDPLQYHSRAVVYPSLLCGSGSCFHVCSYIFCSPGGSSVQFSGGGTETFPALWLPFITSMVVLLLLKQIHSPVLSELSVSLQLVTGVRLLSQVTVCLSVFMFTMLTPSSILTQFVSSTFLQFGCHGNQNSTYKLVATDCLITVRLSFSISSCSD